MIRILPEGECARWGINFHLYKGKLEAITLMLGYRFIVVLGGYHPGIWLNLTLDHKMYRPNDMDAGLICRRCGEYSHPSMSDLPRAHCQGRTFAWSLKKDVVFHS